MNNDDETINNKKGISDSTNKDNTVIVIPKINLNDEIPPQTPTTKSNNVQFPTQLEEHFYTSYPKPPIEDEEKEDDIPKIPSKKEKLLNYLHDKFPSRIVRRVLKCTIAYFLTTLLSLIQPIAVAIGPAPYLSTTGMLFSHPGRTMGAQFDATITAVLGVVAAVLYAFVGIACSVAYNNSHLATYISIPTGRIINAFFLFMGIFLAQSLRQAYPKFHFFSLQFMIIQIFSMTRAIDYVTVPFSLPLNYGIPLMIGHAISLFVNLVCWPETAIDGLGRATKETITSSRDMLNLITKQFFLDPRSEPVAESDVDSAADKMRKGMTKMKTAYREAKYEMSYSFIRPQQLGKIRKSLGRLTKHLSILGGCLKTERELFESAIEALQAEVVDTEEEAEEEDDDATTIDNNGHEFDHSHHPHRNPHLHGYDHDEHHRPSSHNRHSYSEDDLNLLRTALRATNEFMNNNHPHTVHPSANTSPFSSRPVSRSGSRTGSRVGSRANSRPGSTHNSDNEEEDYSDHNQLSVTSLKSFLNIPKLTIPKPKPPKKSNKKQTEYHHRHLLLKYLESLRDPLMELSLDCAIALECLCDSIAIELDMDQPTQHETWGSYLSHLLQINTHVEDQPPDEKTLERHGGGLRCNCSQTIRIAIERFDESEHQRMAALYKLNASGGGGLDLGMRQELFLVFFFIFTMREVANELQEMTLQMDELRLQARLHGHRRKHVYFPGMNLKVWRKWASGNNHQSTRDKGGYTFATLTNFIPKEEPTTDITEKEDEANLTKIQTNGSIKRTKSRRESCTSPNKSEDTESPDFIRQRKRYTTQYHKEDDQEDTKKEKSPVMLRIRYGLWLKLQYFDRYEFRFALKMSMAVLVLCIPAFVPASNGWYTTVRGQWAPMTVIAIMNPTSGGTLQASFWRIVGTLIGAFTGWAALAAGDGSPYLLGTFAVLLALPFFYIHLGSTYNKVGIVTLTTYMVVALSRYVSPPAGETIAATVWKRTITLIVGICVALLLNSLVWPFVARHMVRKSIAGCIGQLEDYYTFIMGTYLYNNPRVPPSESDRSKGEKMEGKIQSAIDACNVLLELTDHEPRFRGPFPKLFYKEMIVCLRNMLDRMLSTRIALIQMPYQVKNDITAKAYHVYRRDMIASMLLSFHTLSASLRTKTNLPVYLPSARAARAKLISQRRSVAIAKKTNFVRFRNLTWFAMACSSEEIIEELEYLSDLVRYVVGESEYVDLARKIDQFITCYDTSRDIYEVYLEDSKLTSLFTNT